MPHKSFLCPAAAFHRTALSYPSRTAQYAWASHFVKLLRALSRGRAARAFLPRGGVPQTAPVVPASHGPVRMGLTFREASQSLVADSLGGVLHELERVR